MKRILKVRWLVLVVALLCAHTPRAIAAVFALPFSNSGSGNSNSLWQQITNAGYPTAYSCTQSNDFRRFRGAFTPASDSTKLAVHSDDGCRVRIEGQVQLDFYSENTHFQNSDALRLVPWNFVANQEYCVEIEYTNHLHNAGDIDGVTLYAYNGGGSVRDGIPLNGNPYICWGGTAQYYSCGDGPFTWSSSSPSVANGSSTSASITLSGLAPGTTTLTVTDSNGKSGSRTVTVVKLGISPSFLVTCQGVANPFVVTNAEVTNGVGWVPTGTVSANSRTNLVAFSQGGTNILTAYWNNCSATATAVVVQVASLTTTSNSLCGSGAVTLTATASPAGYESNLTWTGEGLSGSGAQRTASYSTPGVRTITVSCGTSTRSQTITVHKIDILNTTEYGLAGSAAPVPFSLSSDSVGPFTWDVLPSGGPSVSGSGGLTASIAPGNTAGAYTIRAYATPLSSCSDTATLHVVQVTFNVDPVGFCINNSTNLSFTVNPSSALSLLAFDTVTNTSFGPANTHATVNVTGTNLSVYGSVAGNAWLRVKLGGSVLIGPALQIVQVTFPSDPWYVGVGKSITNSVSIVPTNAPVTFDTVSNSIATAQAVGGGVKVSGVLPGTTQVRAKVGSGMVCSTKDVTAVRVTWATNSIALCNGNSGTVPAAVDPPGAPVTFTASTANSISLQVTVSGTNVTVTPLEPGTGYVHAKLGGVTLDWLVVEHLRVRFPTNDWFVPVGGIQFFKVLVDTPFFTSLMAFTSSDTNIATVSASDYPVRVAVQARATNGSAQVFASLGTNQPCGAKGFSLFRFDSLRFQKVTMAGAWKNIDPFYKFLGVFSGQTVTFGVVTTPPNLPLPPDSVVWSGAASGNNTQVNVVFPDAGTAQIIGTIGTVAKSASVEVVDRPSGDGEQAFAQGHPFESGVAYAQNLIGTPATTLEPFVWASTNYPGAQHNTIADAARHAYWACLLTRYCGAVYAEGLTTAHEVSGQPSPSTETVMDLLNNAIGISLAAHTHGSGNACCRGAVVDAVSAGLLWYLDGSYDADDTTEGTLLQPTNR